MKEEMCEAFDDAEVDECPEEDVEKEAMRLDNAVAKELVGGQCTTKSDFQDNVKCKAAYLCSTDSVNIDTGKVGRFDGHSLWFHLRPDL